ncbi:MULTISPECIES: hypothetical protein [Actinomycetes]|uniref:hypothetical protein n=1 Tax=Actinomycetes TaxID=1760 RepID=UPI0034469A42
MRPKLFAVLAISAVALVGCSAAAPASEPAPTGVQASAPVQTAVPEVVETPAPEEMFLDSLNATFDGKESQVDKSVRHKMRDSYISERGEEYCELVESGKPVEPMTDTSLNIDYEIENRILSSAQTFLCPSN